MLESNTFFENMFKPNCQECGGGCCLNRHFKRITAEDINLLSSVNATLFYPPGYFENKKGISPLASKTKIENGLHVFPIADNLFEDLLIGYCGGFSLKGCVLWPRHHKACFDFELCGIVCSNIFKTRVVMELL